jgi:hypothetical protein
MRRARPPRRRRRGAAPPPPRGGHHPAGSGERLRGGAALEEQEHALAAHREREEPRRVEEHRGAEHVHVEAARAGEVVHVERGLEQAGEGGRGGRGHGGTVRGSGWRDGARPPRGGRARRRPGHSSAAVDRPPCPGCFGLPSWARSPRGAAWRLPSGACRARPPRDPRRPRRRVASVPASRLSSRTPPGQPPLPRRRSARARAVNAWQDAAGPPPGPVAAPGAILPRPPRARRAECITGPCRALSRRPRPGPSRTAPSGGRRGRRSSGRT